eukprot:1148044-Pelagomonas_calceolata.AAC.3
MKSWQKQSFTEAFSLDSQEIKCLRKDQAMPKCTLITPAQCWGANAGPQRFGCMHGLRKRKKERKIYACRSAACIKERATH